LPGDALTSHFPKEASGDGKASAAKENSDLSKSKRGSTTYASYDIDITSYVVGERAAGRDIFSVALHDPSNSTPYILLNSREASANKPQLVLTTSGSNNSPPTISLTAPANGAAYPAPANITALCITNINFDVP
jgi:hypothetical protein